jgi:hypothetical protein
MLGCSEERSRWPRQAADSRSDKAPAKCSSVRERTAPPINPPKTATIARMIPPGDSNLWLSPEASTAEFANFSGDRSPTCELMNMVCCFLAKSWIAQYVSYGYIYNKNLSSFFWRHDFPSRLSFSRHLPFHSVLLTTPCDADTIANDRRDIPSCLVNSILDTASCLRIQ